MRVLLDQGLPRSAAEKLRNKGWDAVHVGELDMSQAPDQLIMDLAAIENRIVITLDADFHALLATSNRSSPSVIRIRREGLRSEELAALLVNIWPRIQSQLHSGSMVTITEKSIRLRKLPLFPLDG